MTVVALIDGPRDGTTETVPGGWPRAQINVDDGAGGFAVYHVTSEAPPQATYAPPVSTLADDPLDIAAGPPGDQGPPGAAGVPGPQGDPGPVLTWLGAWTAGSGYAVYDVVSYVGSSYVAIVAPPIGTLPTNAAYWALVAQKGTDGAAGAAGAPGAAGPVGPAWGNNQGAYNPALAYAASDVVTSGGSTYRASAAAAIGVAPPAAPWTVVAAKGDVGAAGAAGNSPRVDVGVVTAALAVNADAVGTIALGKSWRAMRITTDRAARVRIYGTAAQRDADRARGVGVDPTQGTDHGLLLEYVTTAATLSAWLTPEALGANGDAPLTTDAYITIENRSAGAGTVTVTITEQVIE